MMIRIHILKKRLMIPSHTKGGERAPLARPTLSPEIHTRDTRVYHIHVSRAAAEGGTEKLRGKSLAWPSRTRDSVRTSA